MPNSLPANLTIRPCTEADIPSVARIYAHHVTHGTATFELDPPDAAAIALRWSRVEALRLPWLVVSLDDGRIAGYAYATTYRPRIGYRFTLEDSIYVDPAHAGLGIGSAVLARLIEACETIGARQLVAVIGDSANTASVRLHAKFGFRHAGVLQSVGFKFGRWIDTIFMQRALGPGDVTLPGTEPATQTPDGNR